MCLDRVISLRFCFQANSGGRNCFLYISRILIQLLFGFQVLYLLWWCYYLVSFPHLLNILYLVLLFILTAYGCCSNSKLSTSEHVFNCLQNNQWGGVLENLWLVLCVFFSFTSYILFCLGYVTFSGYWALRKETWLHFIYEHLLFLYLSLERKDQMCVFLKEPWLNLHNFEQACLPAAMSFWYASMHTRCLST